MAKSKETIKAEIKAHIQSRGGGYSDWYVGIATDPQSRLFDDHNVDKENGRWVYRECENSRVAREIEEYFVDTLGTDGGGGGDSSTRHVYAGREFSPRAYTVFGPKLVATRGYFQDRALESRCLGARRTDADRPVL